MTDELLADRTALVVGASTGIGRETAIRMGTEGARVALGARTAPKLESAADEITEAGGEAVAIRMDLQDERSIVEMVEKTLDTFGGIDILVNCAGVGDWQGPDEPTRDFWRTIVEVNFLGPLFVIHEVLPHLRECDRADIVTISSMASRSPAAEWPVYGAAKAAVEGFSTGLAKQVRDTPIRVTTIQPGTVDTPMQEEEYRGVDWVLQPEDIAGAICYAVSRPSHVSVHNMQVIPTTSRE